MEGRSSHPRPSSSSSQRLHHHRRVQIGGEGVAEIAALGAMAVVQMNDPLCLPTHHGQLVGSSTMMTAAAAAPPPRHPVVGEVAGPSVYQADQGEEDYRVALG